MTIVASIAQFFTRKSQDEKEYVLNGRKAKEPKIENIQCCIPQEGDEVAIRRNQRIIYIPPDDSSFEGLCAGMQGVVCGYWLEFQSPKTKYERRHWQRGRRKQILRVINAYRRKGYQLVRFALHVRIGEVIVERTNVGGIKMDTGTEVVLCVQRGYYPFSFWVPKRWFPKEYFE